MQIHFKGTNYNLPVRIVERAKRKLDGLEKYLGRRRKDEARVYVDLGKETGKHHNQGSIWKADISLDVEGGRFYAKSVQDSIEKALDTAVKEVARTVQSTMRRERSLVKKGGSMFKSLLRSV